MDVVDNLFLSEHQTLAKHLIDMLGELEAKYGPRDLTFTPSGIEFYEKGPDVELRGRYIIIRLKTDALNDPAKAIFQLAHESLHLLDPTDRASVTVLEEGLAADFQLKYVNSRKLYDRQLTSTEDAAYDAARDTVQPLLSEYPLAITTIRKRNTRLSDITAHQLRKECPKLHDDDIEKLVQPWSPFRDEYRSKKSV